MLLQQGDSNRAQRHNPTSSDQTLGCDDDRVIHCQRLSLEVNVGPAKGAQLAPAHAGQSRKHEQRSETWVAPLSGFDDLANHVQGLACTCFCVTRGGFAISATFERDPSLSDCLMKRSRNDRVMVANRLRGLAGILHGPVQRVEILGRQAVRVTLPKDGRIVRSIWDR